MRRWLGEIEIKLRGKIEKRFIEEKRKNEGIGEEEGKGGREEGVIEILDEKCLEKWIIGKRGIVRMRIEVEEEKRLEKGVDIEREELEEKENKVERDCIEGKIEEKGMEFKEFKKRKEEIIVIVNGDWMFDEEDIILIKDIEVFIDGVDKENLRKVEFEMELNKRKGKEKDRKEEDNDDGEGYIEIEMKFLYRNFINIRWRGLDNCEGKIEKINWKEEI